MSKQIGDEWRHLVRFKTFYVHVQFDAQLASFFRQSETEPVLTTKDVRLEKCDERR
jgi:cellobiose phosphorylase